MAKKKQYSKEQLITIIIIAIVIFVGEYISSQKTTDATTSNNLENTVVDNNKEDSNSFNNEISYKIDEIPEYNNEISITLNNNKPEFEDNEFNSNSFEKYSELDSLGRCGVAYANLSKETMPAKNEKRQDISRVKPTGWINRRYDSLIEDGGYLYNRCHLIAYKLSAENDNEKNLITGTRYFNVNGMLPFETKVMNYLEKNNNKHILYRVTPIFKDNNLVASGVKMEAESVEDRGESICFNVYIYNVQPGVSINYSTGESKLESK